MTWHRQTQVRLSDTCRHKYVYLSIKTTIFSQKYVYYYIFKKYVSLSISLSICLSELGEKEVGEKKKILKE